LLAVKSGFILFIKSYQFHLQINTLERERERETHSIFGASLPLQPPLSTRPLPPRSQPSEQTTALSPLSTQTLLSPRSPLSRQTAAPRSLLERAGTKRAGSGRLRGAAEQVKTLILESVNAWKNYKMRIPSRSSALSCNPTEQERTVTHRAEVMFTLTLGT
jgi:hypothetical protein